MDSPKWASTVILIDADFLDRLTQIFASNFKRFIGRKIPKADLCHWLDCMALDSGLQLGMNRIQAVFIHSKEKTSLQQFTPSDFENELNAKAFKDVIGEFEMLSFPVEQVVEAEEFYIQCLATLADAKEVSRLLIVADMEAYGERVKDVCAHTNGKDIQLFAMQPLPGKGFKPQVIGYSLLSAMGIRSDEL